MAKKPLVYILGNETLKERISKSLRGKCQIMQEIPKGKKIDYIFYLGKVGVLEMRGVLDLAVSFHAKFLYLTPRARIDKTIDLVFEYEKKFNLDARVVRGDEISDAENDNLEKILEAMFGLETRGGLFFLKEQPFSSSIKEIPKQGKDKIYLPLKKTALIIFTLLLAPFFLTLFFAGLGFLELFFSQKSFLAQEVGKATFLVKIAAPSFALSQKTFKITTFELSLFGKKDAVRNLENLILAAGEIADSEYRFLQGMTLLKEPVGNLLSDKSFYNNDNVRGAKIELLDAQEGLIRAGINLSNINNGFPILNKEVKKLNETIEKEKKLLRQVLLFLDVAPEILGVSGKKTYLVLLQNNMELRPTGGFIGSYGLLSFKEGKFLGFEIFDVYSADGQLKGHVEPPTPIKKYLGEPHWFLRDSNWDPDFINAASKASWFLEKEVGQKVDGVIAMDTSLAALIISAMGEVNVPDYQEIITRDNLYERTQFYAQENFFPGSRQKADFLGALAREMINKLTNDKNIHWLSVFNSLIAGMREKHLLFAFNDSRVQSLFSLNNPTGMVIPKTQEREGILDDFLMIIEANLGVNKVNYFIKRNISTTINIGEAGEITRLLKITYTNQSSNEEYKNYLRIITPKGARIKKVEFDQKEIREVDEEESQDKSVFGFLINIPAQSQKTLLVSYELQKQSLTNKGLNTYQLWVLKQPGTLEDPLTITVNYPSFFTLREVNSREEGRIIYSPQSVNIISNLSQDREFEIKFLNK